MISHTNSEEVKEHFKNYLLLEILRYVYAPKDKFDFVATVRKIAYDYIDGDIKISSGGGNNPLFTNGLFSLSLGKDLIAGLMKSSKLSDILRTFSYRHWYINRRDIDIDSKFAEPLTDWYLDVNLLKNRIREPVLKSYTEISNILLNYKDEDGSLVNNFYVRFFIEKPSGLSNNYQLKRGVPSEYKGKELTGSGFKILIDRTDLSSFKQSVASIVFFMVKYNAFAQIKERGLSSDTNALYISQFGIHSEDYVKTSFFAESSKMTNTLSQYSVIHTDEWKGLFNGVWDHTNIFPIYVFSNTDDFVSLFLSFFNDIDSLNNLV
ncbi:hypothetical protein LCGC14_1720500 [marine sediment metagenome]|uniref:Uncharacterized protein n=1 Tax=marine sediment metagenome TaxID=412755 RepID=A0A0F9JT21_9ZZZZ